MNAYRENEIIHYLRKQTHNAWCGAAMTQAEAHASNGKIVTCTACKVAVFDMQQAQEVRADIEDALNPPVAAERRAYSSLTASPATNVQQRIPPQGVRLADVMSDQERIASLFAKMQGMKR